MICCRMGKQRVKFATQVDEAVLLDVKALAKAEGRQLQSLVEEAFLKLLDDRQNSKVRPDVMSALASSLQEYDGLLKELAK